MSEGTSESEVYNEEEFIAKLSIALQKDLRIISAFSFTQLRHRLYVDVTKNDDGYFGLMIFTYNYEWKITHPKVHITELMEDSAITPKLVNGLRDNCPEYFI